jgi:8-amino-7-oxononanoate synthase
MRPIEAMARAALAEQQAAGLLRELRWVDGRQDAWVECDGKRVLLLCSNNYLGLAAHPALAAAAAAALRESGTGAGASRLISGSMRIHRVLEERFSAWKRTEAALAFPTGYHANIGAITALVRRGDAVFSDELNHASLIDGCRLSGAAVHVYPHNDIDALARLLKESDARHKLIVCDTVFSMDGDVAPLLEICEVADRHRAWVMVDEAHGTGVLGASGAGLVEELGLHGRVDVQMATLSKALGAAGAVVCASQPVIDLLVNRARSFIYTTGLPPSVAAAALAAVDLVQREPERRAAMQNNARRLRRGLAALGYDVPPGDTPIIPVLVGDSAAALGISQALLLEGVFVQAIRPPTVPQGTARLRVTVMATHGPGDIDFALAAFERVRLLPRLAAKGA